MSVRDVFDLDCRGEGATAEAGDFLQGEELLVIGVGIIVETELSPEGVVDQFGSFDMTGSAVADVDDISADGLSAELRIETCDTVDSGGCNPG